MEIKEEGTLRAHRHLFGGEPKDQGVLDLLLGDFERLAGSDPAPVEAGRSSPAPRNPKRLARESARKAGEHGISTKARESLRFQLEERKKERQRESREERLRKADLKRRKAEEKALTRRRGR